MFTNKKNIHKIVKKRNKAPKKQSNNDKKKGDVVKSTANGRKESINTRTTKSKVSNKKELKEEVIKSDSENDDILDMIQDDIANTNDDQNTMEMIKKLQEKISKLENENEVSEEEAEEVEGAIESEEESENEGINDEVRRVTEDIVSRPYSMEEDDFTLLDEDDDEEEQMNGEQANGMHEDDEVVEENINATIEKNKADIEQEKREKAKENGTTDAAEKKDPNEINDRILLIENLPTSFLDKLVLFRFLSQFSFVQNCEVDKKKRKAYVEFLFPEIVDIMKDQLDYHIIDNNVLRVGKYSLKVSEEKKFWKKFEREASRNNKLVAAYQEGFDALPANTPLNSFHYRKQYGRNISLVGHLHRIFNVRGENDFETYTEYRKKQLDAQHKYWKSIGVNYQYKE